MRRVLFALVIVGLLGVMASTSSAQMDFLVFDSDSNFNSGPTIRNTLSGIGYVGTYTTSLAPYLGTLGNYCSIWICLGVFPDATYPWFSNPAWNDSLVSYLTNHGGNIYMEGADCWYNDPPFSLKDYFDLTAANGFADLSTINGVGGTFTAGMSYSYSGDNFGIDRLSPSGGAYTVFNNSSPAYGCAVANDAGTYKTVGASFEFGGLDDGAYTKAQLAESIMAFFGCAITTPNYDLAALEVVNPDWYAVPGVATSPQIKFRNNGLNDATNVTATVTIGGVYNQSTLISVPSGGELTQTFPAWTPVTPGTVYNLTAWHSWGSDERHGNDTLRQTVTVWDGRWYIYSAWLASSPTIDGIIDPGEWTDATQRDVSDFLARAGSKQNAGQGAYLYLKNNADTLFIAMDGIFDTSEDDDDFWTMYFEDNYDGAWPANPDSSEGQLTLYHHPAPVGPWFSYKPKMSNANPVAYYISVLAWSANTGHMVAEWAIPMGPLATNWYDIDASAGDTVGFWMRCTEVNPPPDPNVETYAWWPTSSQIGDGELADIGGLILASPPNIDLMALRIESPGDSVRANVDGDVIGWVRNVGNIPRTFNVAFLVDGGTTYGDTVAVAPALQPGDSAQVTFATWNPGPCAPGTMYDLALITLDANDIDRTNDTLAGSTRCYVSAIHDMRVTDITNPPDSFQIGTPYPPAAQIHNYGNYQEVGFPVVLEITDPAPVYVDTVMITSALNPNNYLQVNFANFTATAAGAYTFCAYTLLGTDEDPSNDTLCEIKYAVGVEEEFTVRKPASYALFQCTPNPLRSYTTISYQIAEASGVRLSVFDATGRLVTTLVDGTQYAGNYEVQWSGKDSSGALVGNGIYFYRLEAGDFKATLKLAVVR